MQRFLYADGRMPVAMEQAGELFYLAYDQVGSLRAVTDASGNVVKTVLYDSFGRVISDSNPGLKVPFGFAGGLQDRDTGLVRFGYRDYDPETGRWTSKDPIGFEGRQVGLFSYVTNNPIQFIDPKGLRKHTILDWIDLIMTPAATYDHWRRVRWAAQRRCEDLSLCESVREKWCDIAKNYSMSDAFWDNQVPQGESVTETVDRLDKEISKSEAGKDCCNSGPESSQ